jgi:hypothetical protein
LLRHSFKREASRRSESLPTSVRLPVESCNDALKGRLDLEQRGGLPFEATADAAEDERDRRPGTE